MVRCTQCEYFTLDGEDTCVNCGENLTENYQSELEEENPDELAE